MTNSVTCSIVINTYNRADYLERLLSAFHHLTYDAFEVVVVNGPSTDNTAEILARFSGKIKALECTEANLSLSRNMGIAAAAGEVVIFIDDDALPANPHWLENIARVFKQDAVCTVGAAGGAVIHRDSEYYEFKGGYTSDYAFQVFQENHAHEIIQSDKGNRWVRRTAGGNSAFRRSALMEIGGFDEYFTYYLDESDVCLRLADKGYQIVYLDDSPVRHYPAPSPTGEPFLRNRRIIARSDTYYCLKNGANRLPARILKTLRFAPQKHFLRELPQLWQSGHISLPKLLSIVGQWAIGFLCGFAAGIFGKRRNRLDAATASDFRPFPKNAPARKLRVCLLSQSVPPDPHIGGIARYTYDLAKGLHELGHEVHIISKADAAVRRDSLGFTVHGIAPAELLGSNLFADKPVLNKNVGYAAAVFRKLIDLGRQNQRFDVVHASNWDLEGLAVPLTKIYPFVLMLVSPLAQVIETENWSWNDDLRCCVALDRWQIKNADSVCCPSWGVLTTYREKMGIDQKDLANLRRVLLGIVPSVRQNLHATECPPGKSLLFVGRFDYRKGVHLLLEALPQLLRKHRDWRCDLVGDSDVPDGCGSTFKRQFLKKHQNAAWLNRVRFHGTVSDQVLHRFYRDCDIFVAPSLFESFGLVYLEAMQYGKPVVACNVGGIPEIVADGVEGLLVEPNNSGALAEAIERLMNDDNLRKTMGAAGFSKVHEQLNYLNMAKAMEACYYDAVSRTSARRQEKLQQLFDGQIGLTDQDKVTRVGQWQKKEAAPGRDYLFAEEAGASLRFQANASTSLVLVALRHDWSGVLRVTVNNQQPRYVDLFSKEFRWEHPFQLALNGFGAQDLVDVELTVYSECNPESRGREVWLRRILLVPGKK